MNTIINDCLSGLNNVGRLFCDYSARAFIQSSMLIILLLIIDFILKRRVRAVFRYCIWMLAFVKLVLPPSFSLPTGIGYWWSGFEKGSAISTLVPDLIGDGRWTRDKGRGMRDETVSAVTSQVEPSEVIPETAAQAMPVSSSLTPLSWQAAVFVLWLVGILVFSVLLIQRMFFVRGLIAQSRLAESCVCNLFEQCRQQLGVRRDIQIRLSTTVSSPAVCGLFKPVILMPKVILDKMSQGNLRAVLIHELAHIKRGDLWVNLAQTILQVVYFYNPFVWLVNAIVRRIREQAVDEMVLVALGAEAKSYSNTLIDIAEMAFWRANFSLRLIGVAESKKSLEGRIKYMLARPIPKSAKIGVFGLLFVMIIAAIFLPMAAAANKEKASQFLVTLSNGVAVDFVGICSWPKEGRSCWRPNGSPLPEEIYAEKGNKSPQAGDFGFMFKVNGPEDLNFSWNKIEGANGWEGSCKVVDAKGNQLDGFEAAISDMNEGQLTTTMRIGIAAGHWTTIASHDGKQMNIGKKESVLWSQAFEARDGTHIVASFEWRKDRVERVVAIDNSGKVHATDHHGSVASGSVDQLTATFRNLKLNQIKEFQYQTRPYDFVTIKNVSLKHGVKSNVQIDAEKQSDVNQVPAAMVGTWFFDNPQGDDEQMAVFPDGRVVVLYSNGHKDQPRYVDGFIELAEYAGAKCKMVVQEDGTLVQYFNYTEKEQFAKRWNRIDIQPRTNLLRSLTGPSSNQTKAELLKQIDEVTDVLIRAFNAGDIDTILSYYTDDGMSLARPA
ncbi:MAG: M56 family metallopeptidase [Sedimentisphaerales bacterium]|nr:M56 family metallopeptidase [Sedimentisphaerales bacterium]